MCPDLSFAQQLIILGRSQSSWVSLCLQIVGFILVSGDCILVLLQRHAEGETLLPGPASVASCCSSQVQNTACLHSRPAGSTSHSLRLHTHPASQPIVGGQLLLRLQGLVRGDMGAADRLRQGHVMSWYLNAVRYTPSGSCSGLQQLCTTQHVLQACRLLQLVLVLLACSHEPAQSAG